MIGRDDLEFSVELHHQLVDSEGRRHLTAWADGRSLGEVITSVDQGWLRVWIDDGDGAAPALAERQSVLRAVVALAQAEQYPGVVLTAGDQRLLLRHAARSAGFVGPLRGDLTRDFRGPPPPPTGENLADRFVADLNLLLPGLTVMAANRPAGRFRSALRNASSGLDATAHLTVGDASGSVPLRLAVPLEDDVMAEGVARGIDTAMAVRRRFHPLVDGVRVFYDQSAHGLRSGTVAGLAEASVRDVHLNPSFALASQLELLDRQLRERRSQPRQSGLAPPRPSLTVLPPFTRIDSVVAHEFWHQIEFGFESSHYRDSVEFRRAAGAYFGVETLEHVIKGASQGAPQAWQVARARLEQEVSAYATTAPKEATAELFAQWWCTVAAPPPSARFFGEVLQRFFPPPS
jgi:hypothetical protein